MVVPRQERSSVSLERKHPKGSPRDLTLIVCTDESKDYFQDLVNYLKLDTQIAVDTVSDELNFTEQVEEALLISQQSKPHRRLFAVLNSNDLCYQKSGLTGQIRQALKLISQQNLPNNRIFRLVISNPGFQLWLLLHFAKGDFSALDAGEWSNCVEEKLEEFIPNFQSVETRKEFFAKSYPLLETAVKNSKNLRLIQSVKPGPSSEIHELVAYLLKLQRRYGE
ncbi:MAG: RloB domain-containing protein [Magnetococcales bacterium]|nr:RloB domain-containing protein [Magnetococcales bacterium]